MDKFKGVGSVPWLRDSNQTASGEPGAVQLHGRPSVMLGARESTTPLIESIILRDDHLDAKSDSNGSLVASPLPQLICF